MEEEAVMVDTLALWAEQGLMLTSDTLRLLLGAYIKDMGPARYETAQGYLGPGATPSRRWFELFLGRHPELRPVRPAPLEAARAQASMPEAVAKTFGALSWVVEKLGITKSRQVYNMDETMFDAQELMEESGSTVYLPEGEPVPEFVLPHVRENGAKATVVACVCADGTALPPFVVVPGAPNRSPFMYRTGEDGKRISVPLADLLGDPDAEVHRRDPPGFNKPLWGEWAHHVARLLKDVRPSEPKLLLLDGCKVHFDLDGLRALRAANIYALMFPSHLSHILQPCDDRIFVALKGLGRTYMRGMLPTIPPGGGFDVRHLLLAIADCWTLTMTPERIKASFANCGMWPVNPSNINLDRLRCGKGEGAARREVNLVTFVTRLKPEAVRQMEEVVWSFGSISNRGKALLANSEAVMDAIEEKEAEDAKKATAAAKKAAMKQQKKDAAAREALIIRDRRVRGPIKTAQKSRQLSSARRQRARLGLVEFP